MKKFLAVLIFFIIIIGAGILAGSLVAQNLNSKKSNITPSPTPSLILPTKTQQKAEIIDLPQRLSIPAIKVDTSIEQVALDSQGNMDVPKTDHTVAWYKLGYKPGEKGNAVLAGHFDKADGSPAVFWDISKLKVGDKIITTDSNAKSYTFTVTRIMKYPTESFPLKEVFGSSDKAQLNLITCNGAWDSATKIYSHRLVVYSELDNF